MKPTKKELKSHLNKPKDEIASSFGVSVSTINRWLKEYNLVRKGWGAGKLDMEKARKIRKLYASGMKQVEIASLMGVCQSTINKVLNHQIYKEKYLNVAGGASVRLDIKVK